MTIFFFFIKNYKFCNAPEVHYTIQMKTFSLLPTITSYHNLDVFNLNWNLPAIYFNSDLQDLSAFLPDSKLDATLIATIL